MDRPSGRRLGTWWRAPPPPPPRHRPPRRCLCRIRRHRPVGAGNQHLLDLDIDVDLSAGQHHHGTAFLDCSHHGGGGGDHHGA
ncbi:MAG: hypothetical protein ACRD0S_13050, partial [Acidimicrobiales bacterium]